MAAVMKQTLYKTKQQYNTDPMVQQLLLWRLHHHHSNSRLVASMHRVRRMRMAP